MEDVIADAGDRQPDEALRKGHNPARPRVTGNCDCLVGIYGKAVRGLQFFSRSAGKRGTPSGGPRQIIDHRLVVRVENGRISDGSIAFEIDNVEIGAVRKRRLPDGGGTTLNRHARQTATALERQIPNTRDTGGNRGGFQVGATIKCGVSNAGASAGDRDVGQTSASIEGKRPDIGYVSGKGEVGQVGTAIKGQIPDAGDAAGNYDPGQARFKEHAVSYACDGQTVDHKRQDHGPARPRVTGDGDASGICGVIEFGKAQRVPQHSRNACISGEVAPAGRARRIIHNRVVVTTKPIQTNGGSVSGEKEAGQAGAVRESTAPDIGDAGWNRDNG